MQTLYQYRTYSVDSSEESGAEEEETQQVGDFLYVVRFLGGGNDIRTRNRLIGNCRYDICFSAGLPEMIE
jgi:hypothetical protein